MLWGTGAMSSKFIGKLFRILNSIHSQHFNQGLRKYASHTLILSKLLQNTLEQSGGENQDIMEYKK